ncbi:hypothetical protein ACIA5G_39140 [Amycolatopsis sp. NPDC051758]|uniref:hypothetical protein n=1 Tax=Amycolatopsis sp. NPDC051758 TaxID=3363935 RepID=UPI00379FF906
MSDEGELVDARDLLLDQRLRSPGRADRTEVMTRMAGLRTRHADCLWAIERTADAEQQLREHARKLARAIVVIADELGSPCGDIAGGIVLLPTSSVVTTRIVTPAQVPGCGQEHQPAWRTAAVAEAARARMHDPSAWRPSWVASVPDTRTDEGFRLLTFDVRRGRRPGRGHARPLRRTPVGAG